MSPPTHPSRDRLAALSAGRLTDDEAALLETHVSACDECASTLDELGSGDDILSRLRHAIIDDPKRSAVMEYIPGQLLHQQGKPPHMSDVTRILTAIEEGDARAAEQLLPLVYEELRKLAAQKLAHEKPGQTLDATALVHEAYLRLVGGGQARQWDSRGHFFAAAAEAMRRILIDQARRKQSRKHGGDQRRVDIDAGALLVARDDRASDDLLALDAALRELEAEDPLKARLVELRYFAGLSLADAAGILGISSATAKRHWVYARSWLYGKIHGK